MEFEIKRKQIALAKSLSMQLFTALNIFPPFIVDDDDEETSRAAIRILNYVERNIPNMSANIFQRHFRISRNTFEQFLPMIHSKLSKTTKMGRNKMGTEKMLLATLCILATPDSYRSVGERFDMEKSSLNYSFFKIINILNFFASNIICWPNLEDRALIKEQFRNIAGLPDCIGAVDGTFVPIKAPKQDPEVYVTRKCNFAITLQATCDAKLKYIDCFVGFPGSVSDTRIFRNSDLYKMAMRNREHFFLNEEYIIGDKAYPVLDWCIPPYFDRGHLTAQKRNFNLKVSQTRQVIERSFALLFGRFRRLKFLDMNRVDKIPATILACCVLHNFALDGDDLNNINDVIEEGREFVHGNNDNNQGPNVEEITRGSRNFRVELCDLLNH